MSNPTPTKPHHFLIVWCKRDDLTNPIRWNNTLFTRAEAEKRIRQRPTCKFDGQVLQAVAWNNTLNPLEEPANV